MKKIKVGIVGGAGYTAGELIRILIYHPEVEIIFIHSKSSTGKQVAEIHSGLIGETDLQFTSELPFEKIEVLFLCLTHGESKQFIETNKIPTDIKLIDFSADFRLDIHSDFVYGLPELQAEKIKKAIHIANPGCFATAIQLALLPLAKNGLLTNEIHISGITGSTGAGVKPSETSHFSWRNNNVSVYKAFTHQHLQEIQQTFHQLQPSFNQKINFIPMRGNFTRGILVSCYTSCSLNENDAKGLYKEFYEKSAFTFVTDKNPDLKQVVNTNKALVYLEKYNEKLFIVCVIDNLLKGASGQAVQNMNLMCGLDEKTGLQLKAIGF